MSIRMRMKRAATLAVVALGVLGVWGFTPSARAQVVFDPTPGGPADNINNLTGFDFFPGNSLAFAGQPLALPTPTTGTIFPLLFQAVLGQFIVPAVGGGTAGVDVPTGTEFTIVLRITEQVIGLVDSNLNGFNDVAVFQARSDPNNFLEIYASTPNANNLEGTGFNDGVRVLRATLQPDTTGNFIVDETAAGPVVVQFDQAVPPTPVDNYDFNGAAAGTTRTIRGKGATDLTAVVDLATINTAFFPGLLPSTIGFSLDFTTENRTPFTAQDPSFRFRNTPGTAAPNVINVDFRPVGGGTPYSLGTINGIFEGRTNESFQLQTDASATVAVAVAAVPEPSTVLLGLTGIGLVSLGPIRARRRRPQPAA